MDNLTHSLAGAMLGQMGLKRRTGLAMPTLILAANLPDIDAGCALYGIESLAMRRGLTHGPIALLVLPLLLWAAMLARSEEHTSDLQSLMRISYAAFRLKKHQYNSSLPSSL